MRKITLQINSIFLILKFAILILVVTILILKVKWYRWDSWLSAAMYYANNLTDVKKIFDGESGGILVERCKGVLNDVTVQ